MIDFVMFGSIFGFLGKIIWVKNYGKLLFKIHSPNKRLQICFGCFQIKLWRVFHSLDKLLKALSVCQLIFFLLGPRTLYTNEYIVKFLDKLSLGIDSNEDSSSLTL